MFWEIIRTATLNECVEKKMGTDGVFFPLLLCENDKKKENIKISLLFSRGKYLKTFYLFWIYK